MIRLYIFVLIIFCSCSGITEQVKDFESETVKSKTIKTETFDNAGDIISTEIVTIDETENKKTVENKTTEKTNETTSKIFNFFIYLFGLLIFTFIVAFIFKFKGLIKGLMF